MKTTSQRIRTTVAVVAAGSAVLVGSIATGSSALGADDPPSGPDPASGPVSTPGDTLSPVPVPATYPGIAPGPASGTVADDEITLSNAVVSGTWSVAGGTPQLTALRNVETSTDAPVATSDFLTITLSDGSTITSEDLVLTGAPTLSSLAPEPDAVRWSEREAGKTVTTTFHYEGEAVSFDLTWTVQLRDGANSIQQRFDLTNITGTLDLSSARLLDLSTPGARVDGKDDGSPIVIGDEGHEAFFLGVENPMAKPVVDGDAISVTMPHSTDPAGETLSYAASIGVVPDGQLRRGFQYYVERERVHDRRTFLHYQSWFDLKPPAEAIDSDQLNHAIELFGDELTDRGATIDSFWIDDGWDYLRSPALPDESDLNVWSFDPTEFPTGFAPQKALAQKYGASLSVWMSPFGGYGQSAKTRAALNASKPADQQYETHNGSRFALNGERYYERFRSVVFDMVDNQGVRGFKLDGIGGGLYQTGPNPEFIADYEALLQLMTDLREHQPEVWINATVGTWGSPYWLWFTDSIFRDGQDAGQAGVGSSVQQYISYRDSETYKNEAVENPLFPVPAVMNHGFIFSDRASQFDTSHDLTDPTVRKETSEDLRAYFGLGLGLQELYVRNTLVDPTVPGSDWFWDEVAANARWGRDNQNLLSDVHWVGGDADLGQVYGTAAWAPADADDERGEQAVMMLRNPSTTTQTFRIDVDDALELPASAHGTYAFSERDGRRDGFVASAGTPYWVTLAPFEVAIFEGTPSDEPPTPSAPVTATTRTQCLGGRAYLAVAAKNGGDEPLAITLSTPYGTRAFPSVAPGTSAYQTFNARAASIPAGEATIEVTTPEGTTTLTEPYGTGGCPS